MAALTPRELRVIADHVERLTKARVVNAQLGIDTTPDIFTVNCPNGFAGTVHWTPGQRGMTPKQHGAITQGARHRDGYTIDVTTVARPEHLAGSRNT